jgi:serine acetyltransferase
LVAGDAARDADIKGMWQQLSYLAAEAAQFARPHPLCWLTLWFTQGFVVIARYRLNRALYLALGPLWPVLPALLMPLRFLVRPWLGVVSIPPQAVIGRGLAIHHPELGLVVSSLLQAGKNLHLIGGNCLGIRRDFRAGEALSLGDDVTLGVNAVVLGPVTIGSRVRIGAGAVVTRDAGDDETLVGVPAVRRC